MVELVIKKLRRLNQLLMMVIESGTRKQKLT
jgi:hypothetical protein